MAELLIAIESGGKYVTVSFGIVHILFACSSNAPLKLIFCS